MKKILSSLIVFPVVLTLLLSGCSLDDPKSPTDLKTPTGNQVFKNYVAVGNSLTAGFMDSGLIEAGQKDGFARQLAGAIGLGDEDFTLPLVDYPGLGSTTLDNPNYLSGVLHFNGAGVVPVDSTLGTDENIEEILLNETQPAPYHNLGVPGAWAADMLNAYSAATSVGDIPFFDFINRAALYSNTQEDAVVYELDGTTPKPITYQTASTGWQAITKGPTLLTLWIGNNDILWGAVGGNPTPGNMTHPSEFAATLSDLMQVLAGGLVERTGFPPVIAVANIPGITSTAYFIDQATFEAATGVGAPWPGGTEEADVALYCFPVLSWTSEANLGNPVPAYYTLTTGEMGLVNTYVANYNGAIDDIAAGIHASGLARVGVVDMNQTLADQSSAEKTHFMLLVGQGDPPLTVEQAAATTIFALDGVHPNNHGYSVVANAFIDVINDVAGASVSHIAEDSRVWDPTYGQPVVKTEATGVPWLSPEAAHQMTAIWQR